MVRYVAPRPCVEGALSYWTAIPTVQLMALHFFATRHWNLIWERTATLQGYRDQDYNPCLVTATLPI